MGKKQVLPVCMGLLFASALVALGGCSGGGGDSAQSSPKPATANYMVSGTTTGLLGTGLVLQNNGTDDLAVSENGFFRFSKRVENGGACNITILSQPTSPAQSCEVVNGNGMVDGSDVTDVELRCLTTISETFDSGNLSSGYWHTSGEYDRKIIDGKLQYDLSAAGEFAYDYLPFVNKDCGKVSADVTITAPVFTGTVDNTRRVRLQGCGYHTATEGEGLGRRTGDVDAAINWNGNQAYYWVYRCLNDDCNTSDSVEYLTPGEGVLMGTASPNAPATLSIDWNSASAPEKFTFQLNNDPPKYFDPVAAGATIDASAPNKPNKLLGVQISSAEPGEMTATVDNVIDGSLVDYFDGNYVGGSFWEKTDGRLQIVDGRLVIETGQEFVDDPYADSRFNNTILTSHDDLIPNAESYEADITMAPETFVIDSAGAPAEVQALLEAEFRPPGTDISDSTNLFIIQAGLREGLPGVVTAETFATGCADSSCSSKYTIADGNPKFATPVEKGQAYRMRIERQGGVVNITLVTQDSNEMLSLDLSAIAQFASTELSLVRLRTRSRWTDRSGEEAFVRAYFDNISVGGP